MSISLSHISLFVATVLKEHERVQELLLIKSAEEINCQNLTNACMETSFMVACRSSDAPLVAHFLACDKVDVNLQDQDGMTGLMFAVKQESFAVTKLLLTHKGHKYNKSRVRNVMSHTVVDVTAKCLDGKTALAIAVESKNLALTQLLLDAGSVDVNTEDNDGMFPLMAAIKGLFGNENHQSREACESIISALVAHKDTDINKRYGGTIPLLMACGTRSVPAVRALLSRPGIDVNFISPRGAFPLLDACSFVDVEIAKLLLAHPDILVNQVWEQKKESAMMVAMRMRNIAAVAELLKHPSLEVTAQDDVNRTLVHEACTNGFSVEVLKVLLTHPQMQLNYLTGMGVVACAARGAHVHLMLHLFNEERIVPDPNNVLYQLTLQGTKNDHARNMIQYAGIAPDTATGPRVSWLAARLLEAGYNAITARDCHEKLVVQEGIVSEIVLVQIPSALFDVHYLQSVGINGLGLQLKLVAIYREVYFSYYGAHAPPFVLPTRAHPDSAAANGSPFPSTTGQAMQAYHALLTTLTVSQCTESLNSSVARRYALRAETEPAPVTPAATVLTPMHSNTLTNSDTLDVNITATTTATATAACTATPPSISAQALEAFHSLLNFLPQGQSTDAIIALGTKRLREE